VDSDNVSVLCQRALYQPGSDNVSVLFPGPLVKAVDHYYLLFMTVVKLMMKMTLSDCFVLPDRTHDLPHIPGP
jgi:hypothetical protein